MATIGNLSVSVTADTTGLATGLKTSEGMIAGFSAKASELTDKLIKVGPAAIAAGAAIGVVMVKNVIDAADKLTDLSERTGIAIEDLSRLGYVAQMSGISADEMTGAINRLSQGMALAASGTGSASRVFDALGVSVKNSDGTLRAQVDVLKDIADKFQTYEDGAAKSALAMQLFGKSGANLVPVLNAGSAGIQSLSDESDRLGNTISTELAESSAQLNDNLDRLAVLSGNAAQSVANDLTPSLVKLTDAMIANIEKASEHSGVFTEMFDILASKAAQSTSPMLRFLAIFRQASEIAENTNFRGKGFEDPRIVKDEKQAAPVIDEAAEKAREAEAEARAKELEQIREHELAKVQAFIDALKLREEARVAATMTEQEAEASRYVLEQEKLLEALELGLITKGEYQLMEQEALMNHRQIMADIDANALDEQLAREKAAADERVRIEQQAQEMISSARLAAANAAVGLLAQLGGKNKAAAVAAIALGKALSIGQIIQNTAVAQMKALATLGPVAGPAAAAKIGMYGKIQAGLVAATGLAQVAGAMSGDTGGITASASSSAAGTSGGGGGGGGVGGMGGTAPAQGQTVNIQLQGEIFGREQVRSLITQINEAVADGSVLRIE